MQRIPIHKYNQLFPSNAINNFTKLVPGGKSIPPTPALPLEGGGFGWG